MRRRLHPALTFTVLTLGCAEPAPARHRASPAEQRARGPSAIYELPAVTLTGAAGFGSVVSEVGDVDADGFDDIVVGVTTTSQAHLFRGSAGGLDPAVAVTLVDVGGLIRSAGDVNGDGFDDVIAVSTGVDAASLYLGSAAGVRPTATFSLEGGLEVSGAGDLNGDGYADLVTTSAAGTLQVYLGGADGIEASPDQTVDGVGEHISGAGDVNGDGYEDVVVSGSTAEVLLLYGAEDGLSTAAPTRLTSSDCSYGKALSGAGDVNGDGYSDVVVASNDPTCTYYFGHFYVYHGSASGLSTSPSATVTGPTAGYHFLANSIRAAGDVDGDGYGDIVVGARGRYPSEGSIYLYLGGAGGLSTTAAVTIPNIWDYSGFGATVSAAGDVDGDGLADLLAGAEDITTAFVFTSVAPPDSDGDGAADVDDCAPTNPAIHPGADEGVADGVDSNCDGHELCYLDLDGDSAPSAVTVHSEDVDCDDAGEAAAGAFDCDDHLAACAPGRTEVCDGLDNNCDGDGELGAVDAITWYADSDGDGYTRVTDSLAACEAPDGYRSQSEEADCDDGDASVHPGAEEVAGDGIDQDCDEVDAPEEDGDDADSGSSDGEAPGGGSAKGCGGRSACAQAPSAPALSGMALLLLCLRRRKGARRLDHRSGA